MHLLATEPGQIDSGAAAVDLAQSPGEIVFLSAADSEIACLAAAARLLGPEQSLPSLRLANLMRLRHNLSVDLYVDKIVQHARLVVVRLLGGRGYWPYGVERIAAICRQRGIKLALLPGDDRADPDLAELSTLPLDAAERLWRYGIEGGLANAKAWLLYAASLIGGELPWREPIPLMRAGLYWPGLAAPDLAVLRGQWQDQAPVAALVFYRALVQAGNLAAIDALLDRLAAAGLNPLPIFVASLKDRQSATMLRHLIQQVPPAIVLNATGFAVSDPGGVHHPGPFAEADCPVLQVVLSGSSEAAWRTETRGLSPADIAMNVALPEVDGRILAGAVSFKAPPRRCDLTQAEIVEYAAVADRVRFVATLAAAWVRLKRTAPAERRIAVVLANYPNRDARIGNGVGLDTPQSTTVVLAALEDAGYRVQRRPADGRALIERLLAGPTNAAGSAQRPAAIMLPLKRYLAFLQGLTPELKRAVLDRWGAPEADPFFRKTGFALPILDLGNVVVGVQPARGYNIDPAGSYHDPALVPPHGYLAFYAWLRHSFDAHALVHLGKHGNLEWLPGKSVALSGSCWPEAALGALPHLYPFIVNDPGEGTQAKRRAQAVIIDHLTPPLTRAGSYGALAELEGLIDEYYEAASLDPRRLQPLSRQIRDLSQQSGLAGDCGIAATMPEAEALQLLDRHLCELKELQIRDGLHVFGRAPEGGLLSNLLVALARAPRGSGAGDASLIRALAEDLALGFDPLAADLSLAWTGPHPACLDDGGPWRIAGDTVERLEHLAHELVVGRSTPAADWQRTRAVLATVETVLRPAVMRSGAAELEGLLRGLDGGFVPPGPSGAPTRGRPEVLPTGRNFYSVDTRAVPTPAAWLLGWKSASLLLERHAQEHGSYPKRVALSAWGTANMRTGGDDIAQALALIGARPTWDQASRRVTGFEILPVGVLGRPRVDVTLRVSGLFRDAFPGLIDLVDSAVRAVAALTEPESDNPLARQVAEDEVRLAEGGLTREEARRRASWRVFGSMPGAYGAGLQALIDEGGWQTQGDLAESYLAWGGWAYGAGAGGIAARDRFEARLAQVDAVLHNQDNREHDLLDSDDYYQFEGGLAAAVTHLAGRRPAIYHNDHARPETPQIRTLEEEIARIVRGRAVNPKWIEGVMRHGYKGAAEIAATVDYLFAFAATTGAVRPHHFDLVYEAYLADDKVRSFLALANPDALADIASRLAEAEARGLWRPRGNRVHVELGELTRGPRDRAGEVAA
ncbi:MAG: cobaltochelatase subunit CobN [Proteobacteria bacterium]|nr:cobaltochelatase subunit CobN [Pseudomonadota bacterium]